ncbi:MAG: low affinity iron permease family protein [Solirubrobacteraceae bacterium]
MAAQHPTERGSPGRGLFDRVAQSASNFTSSPSFFAFCVVVVALWLGTHVAGLSTEWQHLSGDAMAAITLLLLALLKNSELRAEHAVQRKLDAIAAASSSSARARRGRLTPPSRTPSACTRRSEPARLRRPAARARARPARPGARRSSRAPRRRRGAT